MGLNRDQNRYFPCYYDKVNKIRKTTQQRTQGQLTRRLFFASGGPLMKKIAKAIVQPVKCRGCIWGKWRDTKQYCGRPICVKPK